MKAVFSEVEAYEQILELSQSTDPVDQCYARALKELAVPVAKFLKSEARREKPAEPREMVSILTAVLTNNAVVVATFYCAGEEWRARKLLEHMTREIYERSFISLDKVNRQVADESRRTKT